MDELQTSITNCMGDAGSCIHFTRTPDDFINQLPILRRPKPGLLRVPDVTLKKAYTATDPLHKYKNKDLVAMLKANGFYFVISNPEALDWGVYGSGLASDGGTIIEQSPTAGTFAPKGSVISVKIKPFQLEHGPYS